jgi:hypothetical protein
MNGSSLKPWCYPAAILFALPAYAARPVIDSVIADSTLASITINGSSLGGSPARTVYLSGFAAPLAVSAASGNQIVAMLPAGMQPGSYAVRVQGQGNGDFDEFFATFVSASAGGSACASYSNAATSGAIAAQVSTLQGGSYAISAKLVVNAPPTATNIYCTLSRVGPFLLVDDAYANGASAINVVLQGTVSSPAPATYQASCTLVGGGTTSYYNWKIQAVCLQALVSPSP